MSRRVTAPEFAPGSPLRGLRRELTTWYFVTLCILLVVLGAGLFVAIQRQIAADLDVSLAAATKALEHAADIREKEAGLTEHVADAVDELRIPDRSLYLFDAQGHPVRPTTADAWIAQEAARTARVRRTYADHEIEPDGSLRLYAVRFNLPSGVPMVAVAVADKVELEDRYAALIAAFGAAALAAAVLVSLSGWVLVRRSTAPVERTFDYMRRFMADAAHELRTPITVLRGRAEVTLQQPRDADTYVNALRGIEAESERMGRIVNDLLTLARADADERPVERRAVYLDDVTADAARAAHSLAVAKGVDLVIDEFEEAPVEGDPALLRQLVMILLDNATKFTPAGRRVRVRVGRTSGRPILEVADEGIGIADEHLPHVFDRFYRADAARSGHGAGLGLSIARWIVAVHGAEIRIASAPSQGTTATVLFPPSAITSSS